MQIFAQVSISSEERRTWFRGTTTISIFHFVMTLSCVVFPFFRPSVVLLANKKLEAETRNLSSLFKLV